MKDDGRNINSRFSDYEPETDDQAIDKSWEKIKYFLPQEKKRRGFIFFRFPGLAKGLIILSILGIGIIAYIYKGQENEKALKQPKVDLESSKEIKDHSAINSDIQIAQVESAKSIEPIKNKASAMKIPPNKIKNSLSISPGGENHVPAQAVGFAVINTPGENGENSTLKSEDVPVSALTDPLNPTPESHQADYLALNAQMLPVPERNDSVITSLSKIKDPRTELIRKKVMLELFGAPVSSGIYIMQDNGNKKINSMHASAGLGILYNVKSRWNINGHFIYETNDLKYQEEMLRNRIVERKPVYLNVTSGMGDDSTIRYVKVRTVKTLSSKFNVFTNLGLGYTLIQRNKFSMETFVQLSVKYSAYNFSSESIQEADTLNYTEASPTANLNNQISKIENPYTQKYSNFSFGVMPGLTMCYQLNPRLALIFKPAYFKQISTDDLNVEQKITKLKQDKVFINLGLRLNITRHRIPLKKP